jgi:hypothetical protein
VFLSVISLSASDLREKNQLIDFVEDQTQVVQQGDTSLSLAIGQLLLGNGFGVMLCRRHSWALSPISVRTDIELSPKLESVT